MVDLGVCIGAVRKAVKSAETILNYQFSPHLVDPFDVEKATEDYVDALKEIAEYCPVSEHRKKWLLTTHKNLKELSWENIAKHPAPLSTVVVTLHDLEEYFRRGSR